MKKVYVIGHRNPDTDSICSAIAYANLKNQVEGNGYEAYRAGNINGETRYVLDTFGIKDPKYVSDVRPRLKDVNLNLVKGAKATDSLKSAREMMQTEKIVSLPVLDGKKMIGLVSISDVLKADMDVYDNEILAKAKTPYKNVVETLDGTLQAGDIEGYITEGKLTVSAASVDTMEEFVTAKDTVIVANREDAQIGVSFSCASFSTFSVTSIPIPTMIQLTFCSIACRWSSSRLPMMTISFSSTYSFILSGLAVATIIFPWIKYPCALPSITFPPIVSAIR